MRRAAHSWHSNRRALRNRRAAGRRQHGRGISGARPEAAARRRGEAAVAGAGELRGTPAALRARGARGLGAQSSAHLHDLRRRPGAGSREPSLPGDGAAARADALRGARLGAAVGLDRDRPRRADLRRSRRRAQRRHHSPRSEAGEHLRHHARRREAARLRPRRDGRRRRIEQQRGGRLGQQPSSRRPHQPGDRGRHRALHVAGAGARRSARSPHGPLFPRPRALRDAHRPPRLRRPLHHRHRRRDPARGAAGPQPGGHLERAEGSAPAADAAARQGQGRAAGQRRGGRSAPARGAERIDRRPRVCRGARQHVRIERTAGRLAFG